MDIEVGGTFLWWWTHLEEVGHWDMPFKGVHWPWFPPLCLCFLSTMRWAALRNMFHKMFAFSQGQSNGLESHRLKLWASINFFLPVVCIRLFCHSDANTARLLSPSHASTLAALEVHSCGDIGKNELGTLKSALGVISEYKFVGVGVAQGKSMYKAQYWEQKQPWGTMSEDRAGRTIHSFVDIWVKTVISPSSREYDSTK